MNLPSNNLIRFKGSSCKEFDYNGIYELMAVGTDFDEYYTTYIKTNQNKIIRIPYSNINTFNENWEVVNE